MQKDSTFKTDRKDNHEELVTVLSNGKALENGVYTLHVHCQRDPCHIYSYIFEPFNSYILKIGQYPSMEDIAFSDIVRFRGVLEKEYFAELHRAGGLISHGIGIGAFVYLRRIFERLIDNHHAKRADGPIEKFDDLRIEEKIRAISESLPKTLVENRAIYSILSLGIHELDEDTCKKYFPIVRAGIIAILEEDLQKAEREQAERTLRDEIAKVAGELASSRLNR